MKHFGKVIFVLLFGILLLSAPNTGSASISLEFNPMSQSVNPGNTASVDIMVTNPNTLVGAFDFWVNYDSSIISLNSVAWGTSLGSLDTDPMSPTNNADYFVDNSQTPGSIKLVNLWADWDGISALNQSSGSFSLLTLNFDAIAIGTSVLWLTDAYELNANGPDIYGNYFVRNSFLSNDQMNYISIADNIGNGSITVASATNVPEPGTALLLGLGLAALASLKKRVS